MITDHCLEVFFVRSKGLWWIRWQRNKNPRFFVIMFVTDICLHKTEPPPDIVISSFPFTVRYDRQKIKSSPWEIINCKKKKKFLPGFPIYFKEKYRTTLRTAWNDAGKETNPLLITAIPYEGSKEPISSGCWYHEWIGLSRVRVRIRIYCLFSKWVLQWCSTYVHWLPASDSFGAIKMQNSKFHPTPVESRYLRREPKRPHFK